MVFMSSCDGVEFHHKVLTSMPALEAPKNPRGKRAGGENAPLRSCVFRCWPVTSHGGARRAGKSTRVDINSDEDGISEDDDFAPLLPGTPVFKLHGNMPQSQRTSAFFDFARCRQGVLLCTDVAARGLDFPAVTGIVQFDPPGEPAEYVHRVGRTARMGQQGESLIFLQPTESDYVDLLRGNGVAIAEMPVGAVLGHVPGATSAMPRGEITLLKGSSKWLGGWKRALPPVALDPVSAGKGAGRQAEGGSDRYQAVQQFQYRASQFVGQDEALKRLAADAFRSYVRAYSAHPASVRTIFHVKKLHLGHTAGSFGLKETPSLLGRRAGMAVHPACPEGWGPDAVTVCSAGKSASKEELRKRKKDGEDKARQHQRKKARTVEREDGYNIA